MRYKVVSYTSLWFIGSAVLGPISQNMYLLGEVSNGSGNTILRKIDINDQELWSNVIINNPAEVTLGISKDEQYLFYTTNSVLSLIVMNTTTGKLIQWYNSF